MSLLRPRRPVPWFNGAAPFVSGGQRPAGPALPDPEHPNLLRWSEAFDNAAWSKSGAVVTANAELDPDGMATAESIAFSGLGSVTQVTSVPATTVSGNGSKNPTADLLRYSITGMVDGVAHVFSVYLASSSGSDVTLSMFVSGGFVAVRVRDGGDGATFTVSWAKLETPALSAYVKREGT